MTLELVSTQKDNVLVSIWENDKEITSVILKPDESQYIELDDALEQVEIKFSEKPSIGGILFNALFRIIGMLLGAGEETFKWIGTDFITTNVPVKKKNDTVKTVYKTADFYTAKRMANIGFVEDDSAEAYYTLDEERFAKIEKHEIIEVFLVGMVMCTVFWIMLVGDLLEHRYDLLFLPIACIVGGFIILFTNLKNTRDISLIDKFKVDLKYKDFKIDEE